MRGTFEFARTLPVPPSAVSAHSNVCRSKVARAEVAIQIGASRSAWAFSLKGKAGGSIIVHVPAGNHGSALCDNTETTALLSSNGHHVLAFGRTARERFYDEEEEIGSSRTSAMRGMLFSNFTLELCRNGAFQSVEEPMATAEGGQTVPLLRVMTAVLRFFKDDALAHLTSASETDLDATDVTWAIAVPAAYDGFAKHFTRVAAKEAGIIEAVSSSRLQLVAEPEAAYLAVVHDLNVDVPWVVGTKTMIVDCGGSTVDISTHGVVSVSPLRVEELLPPMREPWGSMCVDEKFVEWCRTFLGDENYERVRSTGSFNDLVTTWVGKKVKFGSKGNERVKLDMFEVASELGYDADKMQVSAHVGLTTP